uniref:Uncharacterized protein n=1 Tax=Parascaris univalens TaxID=6257 RepID=A0A914ZL80_PARUN
GEMKLFPEVVYVLFFPMVFEVIAEDLQKPIETVTQSTDETARPENEKQKASDVGTSILVANLTGNFEKVNENLNEILRCCKDHCDVAERRANPMNCKQPQEQLHPLNLPPKLAFRSSHPQVVETGPPEMPPKVPSTAKKVLVMLLPVRRCVYCPCIRTNCPLVPIGRCPCQAGTSSLLPCPILNPRPSASYYSISPSSDDGSMGASSIHSPNVAYSVSSLPQLVKALRAHRHASVGGHQNNDIAELLELGQPIAIEVSENDTATLQELASLGFIDGSTATDGGGCGALLSQQPQSEHLPLPSGSSDANIVKMPPALFSADIDAAASANQIQSLYEQSRSTFESPSNYILPHTGMSLPAFSSPWEGQHQMGQPFSARSNLATFALPLPHQQSNMPITNALPNRPPNQPNQLYQAIEDNLPPTWSHYQPRHFSRPIQPNPPVSWTLGQQGYLTQPSPPEGSSNAGHSQLNPPWSQNQSAQSSLHWQPSSTQQYGNSVLSNQQSRPPLRGDSEYQVSVDRDHIYRSHASNARRNCYTSLTTATACVMIITTIARNLLERQH